jgi:glycolate oxidase FAD binding subunit
VTAPASLDGLRHALAGTAPQPIRIAGAGTKRPASSPDPGPADDTTTLDLRQLRGVVAYDPAECVVTALGGTPVDDVAALLAAHGQYLPWDPPFVADGSTVGGMIAAGWSGPGRYRYGGVRDFVVGATVVDGRGRLVKSGGQVVKNAAGFLLHHAMVGSAGRLGVVAEVSVKVFPRPEATCTVTARAGTLADAVAAHERVRQAVHDLDALDLDAATALILVRLAGAPAPLPARADRVVRALALDADITTGDDERRLWDQVTAAPRDGRAVVKVPSSPSRLLRDLAAVAPLGSCRTSVGGAVIYVTGRIPRRDVDACLGAAGLSGVIASGPADGSVVGTRRHANAFSERVVNVLDPDRRFR